jgi:hypothetical protein
MLINANDESAYEAAFNNGHFDLAETMLPVKSDKALHRALSNLAKKDPKMRLTAQADGRRTIRLKSPLEFDEDTIKLAAFEFNWDKSNPLVHPPREGAVYDIVFTLDQWIPAEEPSEGESETADADTTTSDSFKGTLVSAQDPDHKPESQPTGSDDTPAAIDENSETDAETGEAEITPESE